jgi:UDPglucose 6-dehydrogenase/UDP-N-acetyl-D-galactosamine dehydrogenase
MPKHVAEMMIKGLNEVGKVIKGSKVLIMGMTYKENVPDTRESPATGIIEALGEFGVDVYGYDPLLSGEEIEGFGVKEFNGEIMDGVIVTVAHQEFRRMSLKEVKELMDNDPVIVDVRGIFHEVEDNIDGIFYRKL